MAMTCEWFCLTACTEPSRGSNNLLDEVLMSKITYLGKTGYATQAATMPTTGSQRPAVKTDGQPLGRRTRPSNQKELASFPQPGCRTQQGGDNISGQLTKGGVLGVAGQEDTAAGGEPAGDEVRPGEPGALCAQSQNK